MFTERLGVSFPVMNAGMGHVAVAALAAAVANAGGLGMLATSTLAPAEVRDAVRATRALTDRPFGANLTLAYPNAAAIAEVLLDERISAINLSMGAAPELVDRAHDRGIAVMASVTTVRHARRAARDGVDFVVATGSEAAGHGSAMSTLVLVARLADELDVPLIAAGGVCDCRSAQAAHAAGAGAVSMGTRFALSAESPLHAVARSALLAADIDATLVTDRLDGFASRVLACGRAVDVAAGCATPGDTYLAIREGLLDAGVIATGQVVGRIDRVLTCADIIAEVCGA